MVELLFVIVIAAILMGMAVNGANGYVSRRGTMNARDAFLFLAMRARASAIERGRRVSLHLDAAADRAAIYEGCDATGTPLETYDFSEDFEIDVLLSAEQQERICYTPRGFAREPDGQVYSGFTVGFARGPDTARAVVRALGQVEVVK